MSQPSLKVAISEEPPRQVASLSGRMDGSADYSAVLGSGTSHLVLDFAGIQLIDSVGIQAFAKFMAGISPSVKLEFRRCSVRIINQMNMFKGFCGGKSVYVESFFAPYYCEACDESGDYLLAAKSLTSTDRSPEMACPTCKNVMEFDGMEVKYLSFLKDTQGKAA